jgi:hypothetical protein
MSSKHLCVSFLLPGTETPSPKEALGSNRITIGRRNHRQCHFRKLDELFTIPPLIENVNKFLFCTEFNYSLIY